MNKKIDILNIVSRILGLLVLAIGIINSFWGNDPVFGIMIILLSLVYFPPVISLFTKLTGFNIPRIIKMLLGLFILWAAWGVGDLFPKIGLMIKDMK